MEKIPENVVRAIKELALKYPDKDVIEIGYNGSGDSFDSMWVNTDNIDESDIEDIVFFMINKTNADFNNDGSTGNVVINLKESTISIENYYIEYTESLSDSLEFKIEE